MAAKLLVIFLAALTVARGEKTSKVHIHHHDTGAVDYGTHHQAPVYGHHGYHQHFPVYGHPVPAYGHHEHAYGHKHEPEIPACAENTTKPWCLEDSEYPLHELQHAIQYNAHHVLSLYADVAELNTALSVARPKTLEEETYLCPSETAYVQPLRAINTDGKWRVIVNNVDIHYETLTQTTRIEECLTAGEACPLVPVCYESKCLQKSIVHRFLVYDSYDYYFPFAIETFKLPASCACLLGAYTIDH
ncbi:protein spaetzle-like [Macrobrachium nipponense]|uniref:protein spaetzle-like n=1 Tax=Macrobrachium nipponense TaxID=159736 RepID=UPI0030C84880